MKFLNGFRIAIFAGAAWGVLTYVLYCLVVGPLPLPIAPLLASTILVPGTVSHIIVAIAFRFQIGYGPYPIYAYVPSTFTETLGALLSMLIGLAFAYIVWLIYKAK